MKRLTISAPAPPPDDLIPGDAQSADEAAIARTIAK